MPLIDRQYALIDEIGEGSFARVWQAVDRREQPVVLKQIPLPKNPEMARRRRAYWEDEIEAGRALVDDTIRSMVASGEVRDGSKFGYPHGFLYLVFEWIPFGSLRDLLRSRVPAVSVASLLTRVGKALCIAHGAHYCHRDLKPENILLPEGDCRRAKLADFGIARQADGTHLTTSGFVGTPRYMAPEQFRESSSVGPAADIYSLALLAWELLANSVPYDTGDASLTMDARLKGGGLPELKRGSHGLPRVTRVLRKALSPAPEQRQGSVERFLNDILRAGLADGLWPDWMVGESSNGVEAPPFEFWSFLARQGVVVEDNRNRSGALWLVGGGELSELCDVLSRFGFAFTYTHRRRGDVGWFLSDR